MIAVGAQGLERGADDGVELGHVLGWGQRMDPGQEHQLGRVHVADAGQVALVEQALKLDPFAPAVYVFTNKRRDRVKLILWNRTGFWLLIKRLEADRFAWPREAAVLELTVEQLHWLLDGVDLAAMKKHSARHYMRAS